MLQVRPSAANSCVQLADAPSQALRNPSVAPKARLALFLPGTGGSPGEFPSFLQEGSNRGYHVVGLSYTNLTSINELCNAVGGNADCAGNVREEVLTGRDTSAQVAIAPAEAIEQRLAALLAYLTFHRPADGWGQFLSGSGGVAWEKVSVSGNSQGAGHAAYIAKVRRVFRVGLYAGPSDWVLASNTPVNWYRLTASTPPSAWFGYVHSPDTIANASGNPTQVTAVWGDAEMFNMAGHVVDVATASPPFGGSQRLTTRACAGFAVNEHNCPMFRGNEAVWDVVSFP